MRRFSPSYMILLAVHLESMGMPSHWGVLTSMYPYYKRDWRKAESQEKRALEIVRCFFIKCNELNKLRSWPDTEFFLGYQMFINLAICRARQWMGRDATNEVSHLCVEACENVRLFTPSVSIKWFEGTSDGFMMKSVKGCAKASGRAAGNFTMIRHLSGRLRIWELPRKTGWTGYRTDVSRHPFLENGILRPKAHG